MSEISEKRLLALIEKIEQELEKPCESTQVSISNATNIEKILFILNGNSHPESGIVFKVGELYKWMQSHELEHREEKEVQEAKKKDKTDKYWDVIRGIIQWVLPFIVFFIARFIVTIPMGV